MHDNSIESRLRSLKQQLPGLVSMPGDDRYAAATNIRAKPVGTAPRAIVQCRTAEDVQAATLAAQAALADVGCLDAKMRCHREIAEQAFACGNHRMAGGDHLAKSPHRDVAESLRRRKQLPGRGPAALRAAYLDTLNGRMPPESGHILSLWE